MKFIILTKNEAKNIEPAIKSVRSLGDVVVVDSHSTDDTQDIARGLGAMVIENRWEGYSQQRNYSISQCGPDEWVFFLDADERIDEELYLSLKNLKPRRGTVYGINRRNRFLGKTLRYAGRYPDRQVRLFESGVGRFESRPVHERLLTSSPVVVLPGHLEHDSAHSLRTMLDKHTAYAELEARALRESDVDIAWLLSRDKQRRRRWVKEMIWLRLPFRASVRLFWLVAVRGGFRDGKAGIAYARMLAAYEHQIECFRLTADVQNKELE